MFDWGKCHTKTELYRSLVKYKERRKFLFNDALNIFIYCYMVLSIWFKNDRTDERENLLPSLHGLLFPISGKGSFICIIPQAG